eukprot:g17514.t1
MLGVLVLLSGHIYFVCSGARRCRDDCFIFYFIFLEKLFVVPLHIEASNQARELVINVLFPVMDACSTTLQIQKPDITVALATDQVDAGLQIMLEQTLTTLKELNLAYNELVQLPSLMGVKQMQKTRQSRVK